MYLSKISLTNNRIYSNYIISQQSISKTEQNNTFAPNLTEISENNSQPCTSIAPVNYIVNFAGKSKIKVAKTALKKLDEHINNNEELTKADEKWLRELRNLFGRKTMIVPDINNPKEVEIIDTELTVDKINTKKDGIKSLRDALKVMICATEYKPTKIQLGGVKYSVNNASVANLMKANYTKKDFAKMVDYLNKHHLFDMSDNPHYGLVIDEQRGLVRTCGATENWEMSDRAWITDTMRVGDIQKCKKPHTWTKALSTVAEFYAKQNDKFQELIENPELYYSTDPMQGIPHIFMPKTLEPDTSWFNNKRLESHGLALKEFCKSITDGIGRGKKYGFKKAINVPDNVILAIDNLSKYFKAIKYEQAPSAGNWEEVALPGGLTSDTEMIRSGLVALRNLLYNPKYSNNPEMNKIRRKFNNPLTKQELDEMIKAGTERVRRTYMEEAPDIRPFDASLAFITTSDIKLADDTIDDVIKHLDILQTLEDNLVRENGIIRYAPFKFKLNDGSYASSPDSYLNLNYFNAIDKNGKLNLDWKETLDNFASKDCSNPDMFFARSKFSTPNKEAQWFMVSEMSTGYGKQIEKLLAHANSEHRALNKTEKELIKFCKKKQTEYLNRALARISEENPIKQNQVKANGINMPAVTVSEAHQYVSDIYGKTKLVQGTNAPLAWAVASLYKAMQEQKRIINLTM